MTETNAPQGQARVPGRRRIRHVVLVTDDQETALQAKAKAQGVTIARLLADTALSVETVSNRAVFLELAGIRRILGGEITAIARASNSAVGNQWDPQVWDEIRKGIQWRNQRLTDSYGWAKG